MDILQTIIDSINRDFSQKTEIRDKTLNHSRALIQHCANTIRAAHRADVAEAQQLLTAADAIARQMTVETELFPDIYHAGYTQDAMKELAEAHLVYSLILENKFPSQESVGVDSAAYVNGLAETVGELRRSTLDALRKSDMNTAERLLTLMDDIYTALITVDFPSAITRDLRRKTDIARSLVERTRGDVTTAARQEAMKTVLAAFELRVEAIAPVGFSGGADLLGMSTVEDEHTA